MTQSINLVPQKEVQQQTEKRLISLSTILVGILLVIVGGIAIYFVVITQNIKKDIAVVDTSITGLRSSITQLSAIEISARNLDKKYKVLSSIFNDRVYFSLLMQEINARRPDTVVMTDFNVREATKIQISGKADTYISVADFTNRLLDKEFEDGKDSLKELFSSVTLNSVNLESKSGGVNFSITVEFNPEVLTNE